MGKIKIYTWTFCPYCIKAKNILKSKDKDFEEIVIDGDKDAIKALKKETSSGTVPQIFIDNKFIGGCDELEKLVDEGEFDKLFCTEK